MNNVLIVEDDKSLREAIKDTLSIEGFNALAVDSGESALSLLNDKKISLIISDINMKGMSGIELLRIAKNKHPNLPFIMMTAFSDIKDAVSAMQLGASDYMTKPFEPEILIAKIKQFYPDAAHSSSPIAEDPSSKALLGLAEKVASSDATVLITGHSGTGKEVLAKYIHDHSKRKEKNFIAINCAAIPENMLESTLFGYEKGAFTGAVQSMPGKFELADGGTILLDEISEMGLNLQAKLLRVLQEREVERLGGKKIINLDVRVIATSNRNIRQEVAEGKFREDLYYRLNVFPLSWLPLCERKKDIIPLAEHLVAKHSTKLGTAVPLLTKEAKEKILKYSWPGNGREVDNVMQRAIILSNKKEIFPDDIYVDFDSSSINKKSSLVSDLENKEFELILEVLEDKNWDRKMASETLGISQRTLRYKLAKMRESGITIPQS